MANLRGLPSEVSSGIEPDGNVDRPRIDYRYREELRRLMGLDRNISRKDAINQLESFGTKHLAVNARAERSTLENKVGGWMRELGSIYK